MNALLEQLPVASCQLPEQSATAQHELSQDVLFIASGALTLLSDGDLSVLSGLFHEELARRFGGGERRTIDNAQAQLQRDVFARQMQRPGFRQFIEKAKRRSTPTADAARQSEAGTAKDAPAGTPGATRSDTAPAAQRFAGTSPAPPDPRPETRDPGYILDPLAIRLGEKWLFALNAIGNEGRELDDEVLGQAFNQACGFLGVKPTSNLTIDAQRHLRSLATPGSALALLLEKE